MASADNVFRYHDVIMSGHIITVSIISFYVLFREANSANVAALLVATLFDFRWTFGKWVFVERQPQYINTWGVTRSPPRVGTALAAKSKQLERFWTTFWNAPVEETHVCAHYYFLCTVCRLAHVLIEHFMWNFPHVQILGQDFTLSLRSPTNARRRHICPLETVTYLLYRTVTSRKLTEMCHLCIFGIFAKFQGQNIKVNFVTFMPQKHLRANLRTPNS